MTEMTIDAPAIRQPAISRRARLCAMRVILFALLAAWVAGAGWHRMSSQPTPSRLAAAQGRWIDGYAWLSGNRVLVHHPPMRQVNLPNQPELWEAVNIDSGTRTFVPAVQIEAIWQKHNAGMVRTFELGESVCTSPDGQNVLVSSEGRVYQFRADSPYRVRESEISATDPTWLAGGTRWVVKVNSNSGSMKRMVVHGVEDSSTTQVPRKYTWEVQLIGSRLPDSVLTFSSFAHIAGSQTVNPIYECSVREPYDMRQVGTIELPLVGWNATAALSPDGKKIAWLDVFDKGSDKPSFLNRMLQIFSRNRTPPATSGYQGAVARVHESDVDGSHVRLISEQPIERANRMFSNERDPKVTDLKWRLDGKVISYRYKGELWTTPAD